MRNLLLIFVASVSAFGACGTGSVTQERFDPARSGVTAERTINQANVSRMHLAKTFATTDNVWAQPLLCAKETTTGKDILIVGDSSNNVYGFDANTTAASPSCASPGSNGCVWKVTLGTPNSGLANCSSDFLERNNCGLVGTPTIDPVTGAVYIAYQTVDFVHHLAALKVADGTAYHATVTIDATASGVTFSALNAQQRVRMGLSLVGGTLYAGFSSTDDLVNGWYGWLIGFNPTTLAQTLVFCDTCGIAGNGAGFWDNLHYNAALGSFFFASGNAVGTAGTGNFNPGVYRVTASTLTEADWFAPANYATLTITDSDLTTTTLFPLTSPTVVVSAGKEGRVIVSSISNLGHLESGDCGSPLVQCWISDYLHDAYRNDFLGTDTDLYVSSYAEPIQRYGWNGTTFTGTTTGFPGVLNGLARSSVTFGFSGAQMAFSWDGRNSNSKILWAMGPASGFYDPPNPGTLYALNPTTLAIMWQSTDVWNSPKLTSMLIANGAVYIPTRSSSVNMYALAGAAINGATISGGVIQ